MHKKQRKKVCKINEKSKITWLQVHLKWYNNDEGKHFTICKTVKLIQKEEKGYETKKTVICFTCRSDGRKRWQHFRSGGDYTGSCSGSIFYRMERAAGGIPGEPRGGKSDFLQLWHRRKGKSERPDEIFILQAFKWRWLEIQLGSETVRPYRCKRC